MGANFNEFLVMANYQYKRVYASYKMSYTQTATDTSLNQNYGNNILDIGTQATTTTNVKIQNGFAYNVMDHDIRVGYILNPKLNMIIEAKAQFRKYTSKVANTTDLKSNSFMISFATNIFNRYYDLPVLF